jgi:hypothetical protein
LLTRVWLNLRRGGLFDNGGRFSLIFFLAFGFWFERGRPCPALQARTTSDAIDIDIDMYVFVLLLSRSLCFPCSSPFVFSASILSLLSALFKFSAFLIPDLVLCLTLVIGPCLDIVPALFSVFGLPPITVS